MSMRTAARRPCTRAAVPAPAPAAARRPASASAQAAPADLDAVVRAALQHGGQPLPATLRGPMEARFGQGFGDVRLHADRAAGASALALGAAAFTHGRDIVFSPGALQPDTAQGQALIAHELAHVADAPAGMRGASLPARGLSSPADSAERRARAGAETEFAASPHVQAGEAGRAPPSGFAAGGRRGARGAYGPLQPGVVHRSLLGAGIGAALGGVLGAVGMGLLGPFGAVGGAIIGGLMGAVRGGILGDIASRRERGLTAAERAYAREIYHDAIDFDAVRITRDSVASVGAARTIGNTINLQDAQFQGDTLDLTTESWNQQLRNGQWVVQPAGMLVLIHELGHVWQYQHGGYAYIPSSLIPQMVAAVTGASRNGAYDWRAAIRQRLDWADWNAEQQAECISDYNEALRRIEAANRPGSTVLAEPADYETVALAEPYIEQVRRGIGAVGSARRGPGTANANAGPGAAPAGPGAGA